MKCPYCKEEIKTIKIETFPELGKNNLDIPKDYCEAFVCPRPDCDTIIGIYPKAPLSPAI